MTTSPALRLPLIGRLLATIYAAFSGLIVVIEAFGEEARQVAEGDECEAGGVGTPALAALAALALSGATGRRRSCWWSWLSSAEPPPALQRRDITTGSPPR